MLRFQKLKLKPTFEQIVIFFSALNCQNKLQSTSFHLSEFADESFNKMRRSTVNSHGPNSITLVNDIKALLEALSRGGVFSVYRAKADPRWYLNVFFFEQLYASLNSFKSMNLYKSKFPNSSIHQYWFSQ